MLILLLTLHLLACIGSLVFAAARMRHGVTLLNTFVIIFVLCCCIGVAFFELFSEFLPPTQYSDVALQRVMTGNLIFMFCAAIALIMESRILKNKGTNKTGFRVISTGTETKSLIVAGSIFVIGYLGFWLGSTGKLEDPFGAYKETAESGQYYKYRQLVEEEVSGKAGQGSWTAKKLALNVGPFLMILLAYLFYQSKNWVYLLLLGIQSLLGVLVAGILAQKSFLLVALFSPLLAISVWKVRGYTAVVILTVLGLGFFLFGTLIFQATLNSSFAFAFGELISRVFLVPAFTPIFFYEVVPDALPFRGMLESLYIFHVRAPASWDYSTYDVAFHATGRPYGANANFLAVAYTGAGFFGVLWVTILGLSLVVALDYYLAELEPSHRVVAVCCSGFGFIGITSINFLGALENGFLIGSLIFFAICRGMLKRSNPRTVMSEDRPMGANSAAA